jgi:plastocyanin
MKISEIIYCTVLFFVISIVAMPQVIAEEEENKVIVPYGAYSPVCAKTSNCYVPNNIVIDEGDKIIWVNGDYAPHTVTSGNLWSGKDGLFESKILNHNDRFEFTFSDFKSGIYPYYCIMHPWMKGLVSIAEQLNFMVSSKSHGFR